ncbi:MAG TPA: zinc ribbon domain-containing protein [Thermoplasmata archaeon]|nr:zinc ribbon domain-containing protein [Thermoplasmata archaeon]
MTDAGFFDALGLGAVLLTLGFVSLYVGLFVVPAIWVLFVCVWPVFLLVILVYEILKTRSRSEVVGTPRVPIDLSEPTPFAKTCPYCWAVVPGAATGCPRCGARLLPVYPKAPPPKFCHRCGGVLEGVSRYRRGYCPTCRAYR